MRRRRTCGTPRMHLSKPTLIARFEMEVELFVFKADKHIVRLHRLPSLHQHLGHHPVDG